MMARLSIAMLVVVGCCAGAREPVLICLAPESTVEGERLQLGDVATFENVPDTLHHYLHSLDLGTAPAPGKRQRLKKSHIRMRVMQERLDLGETLFAGPPIIEVVGKGHVLEGKRLAESIVASVRERTGWTEEEARIVVVRTPPNLYLPPGEVELDIQRVSADDYGVSLYIVTAWQDGFEVGRVPVSLRVQRTLEVATLAQRVEAGETITAADVSLKPRTITQRRDESRYCTDASQLIGRRVRRSLSEGTALTMRMIENPPVIKRGQEVRVQLVRGSLAVSTRGKANEPGRIGDMISVRMPTGNVLRGQLTGEDLVVVQAGDTP